MKILISIIIIAFFMLLMFIVGYTCGYNRYEGFFLWKLKEDRMSAKLADIRNNYKQLLNQFDESGYKFKPFFDANDIKKIAIYGYGIIGKRIEKKLTDEGLHVEFLIDKDAKNKEISISIYELEESIPSYDIILVTTQNADEVREIVGGTASTVVELEDVVKIIIREKGFKI